VCNSDQPTTMTRLFQTEPAVIEVKDGESQEEAWKRHLAANPAIASAHIKIFHYPAPRNLKTARGPSVAGSFPKTRRTREWLKT
jgi:hypothetical protein